jgi:hypothetical protein
MSETVDDFMQRFGGAGAVDDQKASRYFDRFASTRDEDRDFENQALYDGAVQHLGRLDDDEFTRASAQAYQQAPPEARTGLLQTILRGIQGKGMDLGSLSRQAGLGTTNPQQMSAEEYAHLANYTRRAHPEVMQQAVKEQPWFVKAMGNPIVMGALTLAAANMLRKRTQPRMQNVR